MKVRNANGAEVEVTPVVETFTVSLSAATAATDTAKLFTLSANVAGRGQNGVILEWIAAQGVLPTDLEIIIDGVDYRRAAWPLPPSLRTDVGALGEGDHGIQVEIRNKRQATVTVVLAVRGDANIREEALTGRAIGTLLPDVGGRPPYYDRNPVGVTTGYVQGGIAPHSNTQRFTYTVPTGKKAFLESVFVGLLQETVATADGNAQVWTTIGGSTWLAVMTNKKDLGTKDTLVAGPVGYVAPGTVITGNSVDSKGDGTMALRAVARLTTFDY